MSLFTALDINTSGLTAQRRRFEVTSSNLNNAETTRTFEGGPYRRKDIVFQNTAFGNAMRSADGGSEGVEVGAVIDDTTTPFELRYDPGHPDADPTTGYVSYPNVNTSEEMINMMSAARSYEANIAAIGILKTMINRTLELGR
jgi:flagellar basal-body rod protein FlgC